MTVFLLLLLIVGICLVLAYTPAIPQPVRLILVIVCVVLAVVLLIVVLQMTGLLPGFLDAPARIR